MKKLLTLSLVLFAAFAVFATDPAQFLLSDAGIMLYADGLRVAEEVAKIDTATIKQPEAQENFAKFQAVLQKHNVTLPQIFSGAVYYCCEDDDAEEGKILFQTKLSATAMQNLVTDLLALAPDTAKSDVVRLGKYTIYTWGSTNPAAEDLLCCTYLADDVALLFFSEADKLKDIEKELKKMSGNAMVAKLDREQLLSFYCDVRKMEDDSEKLQKIGFTELAVKFNMTGANRKDFEIGAIFNCLGKEQLQQLGMQVNMMLPMMLGMAFGNDPSIPGDLLKNLRVSPKDNMLNISLKIPEALSKRIEEYYSNPANFQPPAQPGQNGAAPAGAAPAVAVPATK